MNQSAVKNQNNNIDRHIDDMRELVIVIVEEYNKMHNTHFDVDELFSFEYNSTLQYAEAKPRHTNTRVTPVILFVKNAMERIEHYVGANE